MPYRANDRTTAPERVKTGVEGLDEILHGGLIGSPGLILSRVCPAPVRRHSACNSCWKECDRGNGPFTSRSRKRRKSSVQGPPRTAGRSTASFSANSYPPRTVFAPITSTAFHPSEVELGETIGAILEEAEKSRPTRVVFDSLSGLRLLAGNPFLWYRLQVLALEAVLLIPVWAAPFS